MPRHRSVLIVAAAVVVVGVASPDPPTVAEPAPATSPLAGTDGMDGMGAELRRCDRFADAAPSASIGCCDKRRPVPPKSTSVVARIGAVASTRHENGGTLGFRTTQVPALSGNIYARHVTICIHK